MNIKDRMIMEDYHKQRDDFIRLGDIVHEILRNIASDSGILVMGIEHRVKSAESLEGKLYRKGDAYQSIDDLTDILGARVICYFTDEVDKFGRQVEEAFVIDHDNSIDKRAVIRADAFGYLSLHYICSLPTDKGYPEEYCGKRFEIQIRTILQHAWSIVNHDLGYKSEFGMPRVAAREFARLAGLMEIADDEFIRVRETMKNYTRETREKIINNEADDILIDIVSLNEYMQRNRRMQELLKALSDIDGAEITYSDPESYIEQLKWLKKNTIGDLQDMLEKNFELVIKLARRTLEGMELDILASNAALRLLCRAELLSGGYTEEQAAEFISLTVKKKERAERQAKHLFKMYGEISDNLV